MFEFCAKVKNIFDYPSLRVNILKKKEETHPHPLPKWRGV
jgi:hypothetical protein